MYYPPTESVYSVQKSLSKLWVSNLLSDFITSTYIFDAQSQCHIHKRYINVKYSLKEREGGGGHSIKKRKGIPEIFYINRFQ